MPLALCIYHGMVRGIKEVEEKTKRQLTFRRTGESITKIIEEECKGKIAKTNLQDAAGGRR